MIDHNLLNILVCPQTGGKLVHYPEKNELWCHASGLAYQIKDGIPIMLIEEARILTLEEKDQLKP